jgi:hypothetical protein
MAKYGIHRRYRKYPKIIICCVAALLLIAIGIIIYEKNQPPIPNSITKKLNFSLALLAKPYVIERKTISYVSQSGVLIFTAKNGTSSFVISEQATPDVFSASDQVYPTLLQRMNEYAELQTAAGTVALTKPTELNGVQTAVLNVKSDLIFVRPNKPQSSAQWKSFFSSLIWY